MSVLAPLFTRPLRHLLSQAEWACARLRPHAGQVAELRLPLATLKLQVEPDGQLTEAPTDPPPP